MILRLSLNDRVLAMNLVTFDISAANIRFFPENYVKKSEIITFHTSLITFYQSDTVDFSYLFTWFCHELHPDLRLVFQHFRRNAEGLIFEF